MSILNGLSAETSCPCSSKQSYSKCCEPYHLGLAAPTAEKLMRSRYSAFVARNLDYIEKTSAGPARLRFNRADLARSLPQTEWLGLKILDRQQGMESDNTGFVRFAVQFRDNGRLQSQTERSEFRRIDGVWFYWDGEYAVEPVSTLQEKIGRNDPCHCGSGKKFKKCCGA